MSQGVRRIGVTARPAGRPGRLGGVARGFGVLLLALLMVAAGGPALAHGGDESEEGYILVQQALAHLAHDSSHVGQDMAMEKVDDALAVEDQEGVAVPLVEQGKRALEAGRVDRARRLLQRSIAAAVSELPPAVGAETGTTVVAPPLDTRGNMRASDWGFLVVSVLVLVLGLGLAYRFRPPDSVADLRRRLSVGGPVVGGARERNGSP